MVRAMDVFIPPGYLAVVIAVEALAQAWQTSIQSAQAELRGKLYLGSIVSYASERSTGRMFKVRSDCWGTEWAQLWLETSVCELPDEHGKVRITDEQFGVFYGPEVAVILIREADLQRLIDAKHAGKKRSVQPAISDAEAELSAPPATVVAQQLAKVEVATDAGHDKGGRPAEYDWPAMKAFALEQIKTFGKPHKDNKRLPSKAQLVDHIITTWADRYDQHPSRSSVRSHLNQWLTEID
jgi:hypothetical protein